MNNHDTDLRLLSKELKQDRFIEAFSKTGVILSGLKASGISRNTLGHWIENDMVFKERFADAELDAADSVELELSRRAIDGVDEPVIFQGIPSMTVDEETGESKMLTIKKFSDTCLLTLIKARKPEKFRENSKVTYDGGGSGVLIVPGVADPASWAQAAEAQQAQWAGNVGQTSEESTPK